MNLKISFLIAGPVFVFSLILALSSSLRAQIFSPLGGERREILSTVVGDLKNDGSVVKVLKLKTRMGISLEFLGAMEVGVRPLMERISIDDPYDGYFDIAGEATRLAILDLDGDGKNELIAPTFDENMVARLNAYRFNPSTERFEAIR